MAAIGRTHNRVRTSMIRKSPEYIISRTDRIPRVEDMMPINREYYFTDLAHIMLIAKAYSIYNEVPLYIMSCTNRIFGSSRWTLVARINGRDVTECDEPLNTDAYEMMGNGQYSVVVDGKVFAEDFTTFSGAQSYLHSIMTPGSAMWGCVYQDVGGAYEPVYAHKDGSEVSAHDLDEFGRTHTFSKCVRPRILGRRMRKMSEAAMFTPTLLERGFSHICGGTPATVFEKNRVAGEIGPDTARGILTLMENEIDSSEYDDIGWHCHIGAIEVPTDFGTLRYDAELRFHRADRDFTIRDLGELAENCDKIMFSIQPPSDY